MVDTGSNRRGSARHRAPGGTALCQAGSTTERYRIEDASKSGVALKGGPPLALGTPVKIELWWPMIGGATGHGVVCRQAQDESNDNGKLAVCYTNMAGMSDLIGNFVAIEQMRRDEPMPAFCGTSAELKSAMDALERAGFAFEICKAPLAALQLLQNPWKPITSIVLSPTMPWLDFSVFVGSEYPDLRRVMLNSAESSADTRLAIDHAIVDLALRQPWQTASLFQALGLRLSDQRCLSCQARLATTVSPFCSNCRRRSTDLDLRDDLGGGD